jgi:hypothetical protein
LLEIDESRSEELVHEVEAGQFLNKPGWVRISIHPTTTNAEMEYVCDSLIALAKNWKAWGEEYTLTNYQYKHKDELEDPVCAMSKDWFEL